MEATVAEDHRPFLIAGRWEDRSQWAPASAPDSQPTLVAQAGAAEVCAAVDAARGCLQKGMPAHRRAEILDQAAELLGRRREELARVVCAEVAKPISLAQAEIDRAQSTLRFAAVQARTLGGRTVPMDAAPSGAGKLAFTQRVPLGVVGAITPFNFPVNLVAHKLAPAFAAGCPVVLKPAPQAPLSALELARVMTDAGLPPGWLSVLPGPAQEIGAAMGEHPHVAVISFTGSVQAGWQLARHAHRKKVLLELGGSAPAVLAADADVDLAAERLALGAFSYAGQSCVSVQRVYVDRRIADSFLERLLGRVRSLGVGDPGDPDVICGPVIDEASAQRLTGWIDQARAEGAQLVAGGSLTGRLLAPTVLLEVPHRARLIQQEAFGPVLCVQRCSSIEQALELANDTPFGLQAAVFTESIGVALGAARRLDYGAVLINEAPTFRADHMPYGGRGDSGNTREGPAASVRELTDERLIVIDTPSGGFEHD
jgi:acyl-CoA reductase-like NAD-dependent aldehyde dehydrogenase